MTKKIAIVTGSSSGFGLLTSLELAKRGYRVIATMRNTERGTLLLEEADKQKVSSLIQIHELDVTSEASVQKLKTYIDKELKRVDVLVNNAGYAGAGFVEEVPVHEYRKQFETNVFGVIAVTQAVLPTMRTQGHGKIINVSSISGRVAFPGLSPYVSSKFALEGWSESLRLEMKPFGVNIVLIQPGSFKTNIWSTGKQITEKSLLETSPYYSVMKKINKFLEAGVKNYGDPQEVANKIADVAENPNPTLRYPVGKGVKLMGGLKTTLPWKRWEQTFLKKLK